jgi:hypothetical protein
MQREKGSEVKVRLMRSNYLSPTIMRMLTIFMIDPKEHNTNVSSYRYLLSLQLMIAYMYILKMRNK